MMANPKTRKPKQDSPQTLAAEVLNQVLEVGTYEELLRALKYIARSFAGIAGLARAKKSNLRALARTRPEHERNVRFATFLSLVDALGLRVSVIHRKSPAKPPKRRAPAR